MTIALATLLVNGIVAMFQALPGLITAINNMKASSEVKTALKKRIIDAQTSLPVWE